MENWETLFLDFDNLRFSEKYRITISSSDPTNTYQIAKVINKELPEYFPNVSNTLEVESAISFKKHTVIFEISPVSDSIREERTIFSTDLYYFCLNVIKSQGWHPYPGDGRACRFIKNN
jgi:hypothetical protein